MSDYWFQQRYDAERYRMMSEEPLEQPLTVGGQTIDAIIKLHLWECQQCHEAQLARPRGLGQQSGHCGAYWQLQLDRANHEGKINNVVAHTELGDEAPTGVPLDPYS